MGVTASIVVHKSPAGQLGKVLGCLLTSSVDRIFVIDNSPTEALKREALIDGRIEYRHVENLGFGAGHNVAIKEIQEISEGGDGESGSYHLVLNADVWWEGDVPGILAAYMDANPEVGMVMPKVYYPDGVLQYTCRLLPTPLDLFAKRFLPARRVRKRMERYLLVAHDHDRALDCPYLLGSFLFFRRSALRECGVFDERFFMYPEDIDITRRIHERYKTMYWPGVSIVHEHQAASRKERRMLKIHAENMIRYFNKWGWLFDAGRRKFNKRVLDEISYLPPEKREKGRG